MVYTAKVEKEEVVRELFVACWVSREWMEYKILDLKSNIILDYKAFIYPEASLTLIAYMGIAKAQYILLEEKCGKIYCNINIERNIDVSVVENEDLKDRLFSAKKFIEGLDNPKEVLDCKVYFNI